MPFVYGVVPGAVQTTSSSANTEVDALFIKPGTGRTVSLRALYGHGKGAGLTAISGITLRVKTFPTTASSAGTAITPTPRDGTVQAAKASAAYAGTAITSGTGTAVLHLAVGFGAAGPGGWVAPDADSVVGPLESAATKSIDTFSVSGSASLNYEQSAEIVE